MRPRRPSHPWQPRARQRSPSHGCVVRGKGTVPLSPGPSRGRGPLVPCSPPSRLSDWKKSRQLLPGGRSILWPVPASPAGKELPAESQPSSNGENQPQHKQKRGSSPLTPGWPCLCLCWPGVSLPPAPYNPLHPTSQRAPAVAGGGHPDRIFTPRAIAEAQGRRLLRPKAHCPCPGPPKAHTTGDGLPEAVTLCSAPLPHSPVPASREML